ncbi:hypothetical protein Tco_1512664 [Tanacetum coccineum]
MMPLSSNGSATPFEEALASRLDLFRPSFLGVQDFLKKSPQRESISSVSSTTRWKSMFHDKTWHKQTALLEHFHTHCKSALKLCASSSSVTPSFSTWNVAGKSPKSSLNLEDWLYTSMPAHIDVVRFQEIIPLNA